MLVSIVIPACDEEASLEPTVREAMAALAAEPVEVIVVDDGSHDGTWGVVEALAAADARVRGVRLARNFGHMAALQAGLHEARGAAVITMDADGQHPAEALPAMLAAWRAGAAVVQAVRAAEERRGFFKGLTSRLYYRVFSRLAGIELPEGAADFRLLSRPVVDVALAHPHFALFLRGFVTWTGFCTVSIPVAFRARRAGATKYSLRRMVALGAEGVLHFSTKPLRAATYLGLATCALSLTYLVYVLAIRLFGHDYVTGWASVVGLMALIGGIQLLVVGILGEYVAVVFERQVGRPDYVVSERRQTREASPVARSAEPEGR